MKIDNKTIERLAYLAQMDIPEKEINNEIKRLQDMATVITEIRNIDTEGIETMCNPFDAVQRLRPDIVTEANHRDEYQKLAQYVDNGLYLVPQVIE